MTEKETHPNKAADVRKQAEEIAREKVLQSQGDIDALSPTEIRQTLHELRVHQIELEMREEDLLRVQAQLDAARALYFDLFDLAPVGYVTISKEGLILEANRAAAALLGLAKASLTAANLLGLARDDLAKQPLTRFILTEDQDIYYLNRKQLFEAHWASSRQAAEPQVWEQRMVKMDGTAFWAQMEASAAQDADGTPVERVVLTDITKRKQTEEALRESEEQYRLVANNIPDIIYSLNSEGNVLTVNSSAFERYGYSEQNAKGKPFLDFVHPDDREILISSFLKAIEDKRKVTTGLQFRIVAENGVSHWFELNAKARFDSHDRYIGEDGVLRDITERKLAEEALESSSSLLIASLEATADGLLIVDSERRVTTYNQKFAEMWKIPADVIASHDDDVLLNYVIKQLADPGTFLAKVKEIYATPEEASFDQIEFGDGRVFERYSQPQIIGDNIVGRVWSFRDITARKQAEEMLWETRQRFQGLVETLYDWIWEVDPQGHYTYISPRIKDILGYEPEEVLGKTPFDLMPAEEVQSVAEIFGSLTTKQKPIIDLENINLHKDGRLVIMETSGLPFYDSKGNFKGYRGTDRNITERKQAENKLQERLKELSCLYGMSSLTERPGITLNEILKGMLALIPPAWQFPEIVGTRIVVEEQTFQTVNFLETSWNMTSGIIVNGKPVGQVEICYLEERRVRDEGPFLKEERQLLDAIAKQLGRIINRIRMQKALRESEERLKLVIQGSNDAPWDWDLIKDELFYSPQWWRQIGYTPNEIPADSLLWKRLMHPDDKALADKIFRGALKNGQESYEVEFRLLHKDGHYVPVLSRAFISCNEDKQPIRVSGTNMDLTARKQAEADKAALEAENRQLQKSESLGRMAGAIAHTFNNQLGVVIGNLELALMDLPQGSKPVNSLTTAMLAAGKAAAVSGQMLTYLGQSFDKRERLDLSDACRKSLPMFQAIMPGNVVLETDLPSLGPSIIANAIEIQQVLTNLITNAWEAVGAGRGSIHLRVKTVSPAEILTVHRKPIDWQPQDNAYACLEVTDTGCGIADKDTENIFDPFFSSKFTGRGMGLAAVLGIVKAHGGAVTVVSEPGHGSTFRVFLPVSAEEVPQQPDKDVQPSSIEAGGTVLLVEDEEMVRNMAAAMLNRLGFSVLEAKDGVEAVEVFRQRQDEIRLVLSDLTMPHMDGWETLTALRKLAPDIPVILASGYDKAHVMSGDHPELPQVFLGKPYRLKELSDAISQALVRRK